MICIRCNAKIPDVKGLSRCPNCGALLDGSPVTGDTKVAWPGSADSEDKTIVYKKTPGTAGSVAGAGAYTAGGAAAKGSAAPGDPAAAYGRPGVSGAGVMRTNPQMEFTAEDFERFQEFDGDDSNPYGIEIPGRPGITEKNASNLSGDATVVLEQLVDAPRRHEAATYRRGDSVGRAPKEKYFPNGFLEEHPDVEPPRAKHRIGGLDILILLLGIAVAGLCGLIFRTSDGMALIASFVGGDVGLLLENINDVTYFVQNQEVTWRLYYEIAALVIIAVMITVVFIVLHAFVKNQGLGILKAVLLLAAGVGLAVLCAGYGCYYLLSVRNSIAIAGGASGGMVVFAGVGMFVVAGLWLIYMCIWGFTSFFKNFHVASMALLALGFVFAILFVGLNLLTSYRTCRGLLPTDALYEMMSTPMMVAAFMVLSLLAALEDYLAKRVIEDEED